MRYLIKSILMACVVTQAVAQTETQCSPTTYRCLSPHGTEFGIVGPVNMWYSLQESGCVPSPRNLVDGCTYVAQMCNRTHPNICQGDCLAGSALSYSQERSCTGVVAMSPPSSEQKSNLKVEFWESQFQPNQSNQSNQFQPAVPTSNSRPVVVPNQWPNITPYIMP